MFHWRTRAPRSQATSSTPAATLCAACLLARMASSRGGHVERVEVAGDLDEMTDLRRANDEMKAPASTMMPSDL